MARIFFDIVSRHTRRYDFRGRILTLRTDVIHLAELVALDCAVSEDEDWTDGEVQVPDADGTCLLSLPIRLDHDSPGA